MNATKAVKSIANQIVLAYQTGGVPAAAAMWYVTEAAFFGNAVPDEIGNRIPLFLKERICRIPTKRRTK
jgi:hypothetical protein